MQVRNKVNPSRRVVNLLQEMAKKITEEGEQEAALYKNFEVPLPNHQPGIEDECGGGKRQDDGVDVQDPGGRRFGRVENRDQSVPRVARKSQALDDKGACAFDAESSDLAANIDALTMAIAALEKGVSGSSFLQSRVGSAIRKVAMSAAKVSDSDRSTLLSSCRSVTVRDTHRKVARPSAF